MPRGGGGVPHAGIATREKLWTPTRPPMRPILLVFALVASATAAKTSVLAAPSEGE